MKRSITPPDSFQSNLKTNEANDDTDETDKKKMTSTAMTITLKAEPNLAKLAHNYFAHWDQMMDRNNTMNATINTTKKNTQAGEEEYEDDADG